MTAVLQVEHISKRYPAADVDAVRDVSFEVAPGEVLALLGASGCGKTTTLRIIAGFEHADQGRVRLGDRLLSDANTFVLPQARNIGFVFQDYALFPHLDVWHNVAFGLGRMDREARARRVEQMLAMLDLTDVARRRPQHLSGGQQQRVALARSMAIKPQVLLLDEPFSNLDAKLRQSARAQVRALLKEQGMSAILVTHDQEEALEFADRIGVMRSGKLEQIDTPEEIYERPRTAYVAKFIGRANVLSVDADGTQARCRTLGKLELDVPAQGAVDVLLRPESLRLESMSGEPAMGTIASRRFIGARTVYHVISDGVELMVDVPGRTRLTVGDAVRLSVQSPATVLRGDPA